MSAFQQKLGWQPLPSIARFSAAGTTRALLMAPYLALTAVFFVLPLALVVARSLTLDSPASDAGGITLQNYIEVLSSSVLRSVVVRTFAIAAYTTMACFTLGFPTAYLISKLSRTPATILTTLIFLPFWVSVLVRLFSLTIILGRDGPVNSVLIAMGAGRLELLFNTTATVIGMTNYLLPFMIIILYSGMIRVDPAILLAARATGATPGQAFVQVFVPQVKPVVASACTLVFVLSLGFFLTPAVLGGARGLTVALYIQQQISVFRWGVASAIGVLLLVISLLGYLIVIRLAGLSQLIGPSSSGTKGTSATEKLKFSATVTLLWCVAAASITFLLLPLIVTILTSFGASRIIHFPPEGWTFKWYQDIFHDPDWIHAIGRSLAVGLLTAILSTLVALGLARAVSGFRSSFLRAVMQTAVYAPLVVPIILLAIGMFDVETRLGLLDSIGGLVPLHMVIAIPLAFAVLSSALDDFDPDLEAAARALGSSRTRAFWSVTIPNIKGSLLGSLIVSFVTSWDEAVIALFQTSFNKTLPVRIFSYLQSGVEPVVPALATLLIALVVLGVAIRVWQAR
ncbi:ABC transporter permease subunit [Mesorhizobium sp. WSM3876]|uniref:ABC transporter permease subunit n=1 Tax=Mesorhizobium sp. WSM3876 TaxID=422277 RepID=UPI001140B705|nr:ABC transporter permease subunit [Mesorhizobium sp. WSM3876]